MILGLVSGYFAPLHSGHLAYINAAKADCDFLVVIVNNDDQLVKKTRQPPFMDEKTRLDIIRHLRPVDLAVLSIDSGDSVQDTIFDLTDMLYYDEVRLYNSGDRDPDAWNAKEMSMCDNLNIQTIYLDLPKVDSSRNYR